MDVFYSIGIAGMLILIGAFFTIISKKIKYPLMLLLLLIGMIFGPITGFFNPFNFHPVINSFVTLALVIVLFEVGYNTRFSELKNNLPRSIWITIISVFFTVTLCALIVVLFLKVDILHGILLGALLASTDLTIVAPLMDNIAVLPKLRSYLEIESSLNSVISAVIAIAVINIIQIGAGVSETLKIFLINIFVGIGLGFTLGYIIFKIVKKLNIEEKPHIISIGSVLLAYAIAEFFGASGIITALVIGMIFGNARPPLPKIIQSFGGELQMILLTFVYVLLGTFLKFDFFAKAGWILIPIIMVLLLARFFMAKFGLQDMDTYSKIVAVLSGPRGIVSALLILSYATLFSQSEIIIGIGFSIVLITSLIVLIIPLLPKPKHFRTPSAKKRMPAKNQISTQKIEKKARKTIKNIISPKK